MTMKENCTGLQHLGLPTKDLQATIDFYTKIGFEIAWQPEPGSPFEVVFLKLNDLSFEAYHSDNPAMAEGAIAHVAINVKDVEEAYKFCLENGFTMIDKEIRFLPFFDKGVRFFNTLGVNNEIVEFNQYL